MDLHANNTYVVLADERDKPLYDKRLPNRLDVILRALEPYQQEIVSVAVESTFNWYWLVDGLKEAGYGVQLVNTNAVQQYDGLKFTDDRHDARWLAHLIRLGILPTGYIYPKLERPVSMVTEIEGGLFSLIDGVSEGQAASVGQNSAPSR